MSLTAQLNNAATALYRSGRYDEGLTALSDLLSSLSAKNIAPHYTIHSNRAACLIKLGRHDEALVDLSAAEKSLAQALPSDLASTDKQWVKLLARKGEALVGLKLPHLAAEAFEEILSIDPYHEAAKRGLGETMAKSSIVTSETSEISSLFLSSFHEPRMTPKQAERDQATRDLYNFLEIKTSILLPSRLLSNISTTRVQATLSALDESLKLAIKHTRDAGLDPRVMVVGSAFLLPLMAHSAGAYHVTVCEPSPYLALGAKSLLESNGANPLSYTIISSRPCDLTTSDIPCNILLCASSLISDGYMLESSFLPMAFSHGCMVHAPIFIPSSISITAQALDATGRRLSLPKHLLTMHVDHPAKTTSTSCDLEMIKGGEWSSVQMSEEIVLYKDVVINCEGSLQNLSTGGLDMGLDVKEGEMHTLWAAMNGGDVALWVEGGHLFKGKRQMTECAENPRVNNVALSLPEPARVLILGRDSGSLSLVAAREGARVVAVETDRSGSIEHRRLVARNGLGIESRISILNLNIDDIRPSHLFQGMGANVVLLGNLLTGLPSLETFRGLGSLLSKNASLEKNAVIIPSEVCLTVQGIQVSPPTFQQMDLSSLSCYRFTESILPVDLMHISMPHKTLTEKRVLQIDLMTPKHSHTVLDIIAIDDGLMNAVLISGPDQQPMIIFLAVAPLLTKSSRIGLHIGPSYEISMVEADQFPAVSVPKPPWLVKWGGGSSIENPHVQRAEYCQLIVSDFVQRASRNTKLKSGLFQELAVMRRSAASLFLHRASIDQITDTLKEVLGNM